MKYGKNWGNYAGTFSKKLGTATTDANGYFAVWSSNCVWFEGGKLEIFLKIRAKNSQYGIRAKHSMVLGLIDRQITNPTNWYFNNGNISNLNLGITFTSKEAMKAVNFATLAFDFVNAKSGRSISGPLTIRTELDLKGASGFFLPNSECNLGNSLFGPLILPLQFISRPTIYLHNRAARDENTMYHEFGHFLMWKLQGECWSDAIAASFADYETYGESNPRIAWTEGWANGFMAICDAYYFDLDNERALNDFGLNSVSYEKRQDLLQVSNGLNSIYYIGAALFDLWDGPNNYSHLTTPPTFNDQDTDPNNWDNGVFDDVEFSFSTLCDIIVNGGSVGGQIGTVQEFGEKLVAASPTNCGEENQVLKVFEQNKVVYDVDNYLTTAFSTDIIENSVSTIYPGSISVVDKWYLQIGIPFQFYTEEKWDKQVLDGTSESFNYSAYTTTNGQLSDNLTIRNGAILYFNNNIPEGWVVDNSSYRPPIPSQMNNTLCGIELVIDDQGIVIVGDGVVDCTAEVLATNNSVVSINNGGTLIIQDNSKLIIDSDSRLVFEDGASIVLNGSNAVLEVKGKIEIGDNATFTYTGDGYLKTEFYPCLNCDNIIAGSGSKIHLEGSGMSDKILEVADYTHFEPDASVTDFALLNGLVEMGKNSVLHVRGAIPNFQYLKVTAIDPNHPFDQIMLNGNPQHTFQNMEISYADKGINDRQIYGGGGLELTNVNIHDCDYAIYTHGVGARLENCDILNNNIGWEMHLGGSAYQSSVKTSLFSGNGTGIHYSSGGGDLFLNHSNINSNITGVYFIGSGTLSGYCSSISNNISNGITIWYHSTLDFSNQSTMNITNNQTGYSGSNSPPNITLNKLRNLYLDNGHNSFEPLSNNMSFAGYIEDYSPSLMGTNTILANNNNWNASASSPVSGTDYTLKVPTLQPDIRYIVDNTPRVPDPEDCMDVIIGPGFSSMIEDDSLPTKAKSNIAKINTGYFKNKSIRVAIAAVKALQLDTTNRFSSLTQKNNQIIELYRQILTSPIDDKNSKASYYQTYAYNEMKKVFGQMVDSGLVSTNRKDNYPMLNSITLKMLEAIDTLALPKYNTGHTYQEKFFYNVEKALLYRRAGRIEVADSILKNIKRYVASSDSNYLANLSCKVSLEKQLLFNRIDYDTFLANLKNCKINTKQLRQKKTMDIEEDSVSELFYIYPNPSKGFINIESQKRYVNEPIIIKVYNSKGQLVYNNQYYLKNQKLQKTIDLSNFPSGLYFLKFQSNSHNESKVVVIN